MISVRPEGSSSLSISTGTRYNIAVNEQVTFTCSHQQDSNPEPDNYEFNKDGQEQQNSSSTTWSFSSDDVTKGGEVTCSASNEVGPADDSDPITITIEGTNNNVPS